MIRHDLACVEGLRKVGRATTRTIELNGGRPRTAKLHCCGRYRITLTSGQVRPCSFEPALGRRDRRCPCTFSSTPPQRVHTSRYTISQSTLLMDGNCKETRTGKLGVDSRPEQTFPSCPSCSYPARGSSRSANRRSSLSLFRRMGKCQKTGEQSKSVRHNVCQLPCLCVYS